MTADLYVGIDIGKMSHVACFLSSSLLSRYGRYEACPTFPFENSRSGFEKLLAALQSYAPTARSQVLLEKTGHYGAALEQYLQEQGVIVYLVHVQEKKKKRKQKSDKRDAQNLAVLLYNQVERGVLVADKAQIVYKLAVPNETARLLRGLVQHRQELMKEIVRRKNKLTAIADEVFPELTTAYENPNGPSALRLREQFPTPANVMTASLDELCATRKGTRPSRKRLAALQELAKSTIGTKDKSRISSLLIEQKQLIIELCLLQEHEEALNAEIEQVVRKSREGQILMSFQCIGPTQAANLIAAIGSIANFESSAKLRSYCGWSPLQRQTGTSMDTVTLGRAGNRILKHTMYLVTMSAIRLDTPWRALYNRLVPVKCRYDDRLKRYRGRRKVVGRIGGQLITVIYTLLKRDYDLLQRTPVGSEPPSPELYDASKHRVKKK